MWPHPFGDHSDIRLAKVRLSSGAQVTLWQVFVIAVYQFPSSGIVLNLGQRCRGGGCGNVLSWEEEFDRTTTLCFVGPSPPPRPKGDTM